MKLLTRWGLCHEDALFPGCIHATVRGIWAILSHWWETKVSVFSLGLILTSSQTSEKIWISTIARCRKETPSLLWSIVLPNQNKRKMWGFSKVIFQSSALLLYFPPQEKSLPGNTAKLYNVCQVWFLKIENKMRHWRLVCLLLLNSSVPRNHLRGKKKKPTQNKIAPPPIFIFHLNIFQTEMLDTRLTTPILRDPRLVVCNLKQVYSEVQSDFIAWDISGIALASLLRNQCYSGKFIFS